MMSRYADLPLELQLLCFHADSDPFGWAIARLVRREYWIALPKTPPEVLDPLLTGHVALPGAPITWMKLLEPIQTVAQHTRTAAQRKAVATQLLAPGRNTIVVPDINIGPFPAAGDRADKNGDKKARTKGLFPSAGLLSRYVAFILWVDWFRPYNPTVKPELIFGRTHLPQLLRGALLVFKYVPQIASVSSVEYFKREIKAFLIEPLSCIDPKGPNYGFAMMSTLAPFINASPQLAAFFNTISS